MDFVCYGHSPILGDAWFADGRGVNPAQVPGLRQSAAVLLCVSTEFGGDDRGMWVTMLWTNAAGCEELEYLAGYATREQAAVGHHLIVALVAVGRLACVDDGAAVAGAGLCAGSSAGVIGVAR